MSTVTVGRVVHYQPSAELPPCAALVTEVAEHNVVGLRVFTPTGDFVAREVQPAPDGYTPSPGRWSWPPRGL